MTTMTSERSCYLSREDAVELDPVELRLGSRPHETTRLGGFFGAIRDAMPDFWGRRVIEPPATPRKFHRTIGTSMGGARPKAVIEHEGSLWVAKFSHPNDRWNQPRVEHALLALARKVGINAAESRIQTVAGKDILLVRRF